MPTFPPLMPSSLMISRTCATGASPEVVKVRISVTADVRRISGSRKVCVSSALRPSAEMIWKKGLANSVQGAW